MALGPCLFLICNLSKTRNTQSMTVSMETWPRENQSERSDLPCHIVNLYIFMSCAIFLRASRASQKLIQTMSKIHSITTCPTAIVIEFISKRRRVWQFCMHLPTCLANRFSTVHSNNCTISLYICTCFAWYLDGIHCNWTIIILK